MNRRMILDLLYGRVSLSMSPSRASASAADLPHMSLRALSPTQTAGLSTLPNRAQRLSAVSWTQRKPAGFPAGIPGIDEEIDGAMQHAPQPGLHLKLASSPDP